MRQPAKPAIGRWHGHEVAAGVREFELLLPLCDAAASDLRGALGDDRTH